jgi:hypothetical protein
MQLLIRVRLGDNRVGVKKKGNRTVVRKSVITTYAAVPVILMSAV